MFWKKLIQIQIRIQIILKVLRKRKANTKLELIGTTSKLELRKRTLEFRKRVKRNQAIHKRRKERKEDKINLKSGKKKSKKKMI